MEAGPRAILVVEDDSTDVLLLERAFRRANLSTRLHIVSNGEEAIAYLKGEGPYSNRETCPMPELILLDLNLPRKSGFEVLAWVRDHRELKSVPIIVLTGSRRTIDVDQAYALGASSYLAKPSGNYDRLASALRDLSLS
jgi:CheY-like chemotaxis protein